MRRIFQQLREFDAEHQNLLTLGALCFLSTSVGVGIFQDFTDPTAWVYIFAVQALAAAIWTIVCEQLKCSDLATEYDSLKKRIREQKSTLAELNAWKVNKQNLIKELSSLEREISDLKSEKNDLVREVITEKQELEQVVRDLKNCRITMGHVAQAEKNRELENLRKKEERDLTEQKALLQRINKLFEGKDDTN